MPVTAPTPVAATPPNATPETRITGLDGIRGAMTLMVVVSHFFAEVPNGVPGLAVGWLGVVGFYVLSGFLIGRLILDKKDCKNFVLVFYVRRFCRMMPAFFVVLFAVFAIYWTIGHLDWVEFHPPFPLWTYATFTQNFYMISAGSIGPHWLAPTWTLAVEEHFYLVAPAALMFTPRRHLMKGLIALAVISLGLRIAVFGFGLAPYLAGRVLLPMVADTLIAGIMCAVLIKRTDIDWTKYDLLLRLAAPVCITLATVSAALDRAFKTEFFPTIGTTLLAIGAAGLILSIMRGAPEAKRFESPILCFFGHMSYCIYLTHLAVLGLLHGLLLGATPDMATGQQFLVTVLALPVTVLVGWLLYKAVEEPGLNYGRRWAWSKERRASAEPLMHNIATA